MEDYKIPDVRKISEKEYKILENIKPSKLYKADGSIVEHTTTYKLYNGRTYMLEKGISVGWKRNCEWLDNVQVFKREETPVEEIKSPWDE